MLLPRRRWLSMMWKMTSCASSLMSASCASANATTKRSCPLPPILMCAADFRRERQERHNESHAPGNTRDGHGARVDEAARQVETARRALEAAQEGVPVEPDRDIDREIAELRAQLDDDVLAEFERQRL